MDGAQCGQGCGPAHGGGANACLCGPPVADGRAPRRPGNMTAAPGMHGTGIVRAGAADGDSSAGAERKRAPALLASAGIEGVHGHTRERRRLQGLRPHRARAAGWQGRWATAKDINKRGVDTALEGRAAVGS